MERVRADLAAAQADVNGNRVRATTASAQLRALLDGVTEAAAVFDSDLKMAVWNDRFLAAAGLEAETLRAGLPLDQLIRQHRLAGLFGPQPDAEAEIARRTQILLAPESDGSLTQLGPEGKPIPCSPAGCPTRAWCSFWVGWRDGSRRRARKRPPRPRRRPNRVRPKPPSSGEHHAVGREARPVGTPRAYRSTNTSPGMTRRSASRHPSVVVPRSAIV